MLQVKFVDRSRPAHRWFIIVNFDYLLRDVCFVEFVHVCPRYTLTNAYTSCWYIAYGPYFRPVNGLFRGLFEKSKLRDGVNQVLTELWNEFQVEQAPAAGAAAGGAPPPPPAAAAAADMDSLEFREWLTDKPGLEPVLAKLYREHFFKHPKRTMKDKLIQSQVEVFELMFKAFEIMRAVAAQVYDEAKCAIHTEHSTTNPGSVPLDNTHTTIALGMLQEQFKYPHYGQDEFILHRHPRLTQQLQEMCGNTNWVLLALLESVFGVSTVNEPGTPPAGLTSQPSEATLRAFVTTFWGNYEQYKADLELTNSNVCFSRVGLNVCFSWCF